MWDLVSGLKLQCVRKFCPSVCDCLSFTSCAMSDNAPPFRGCRSNERLVCDKLKESSKKLGKLIQERDLSSGLVVRFSEAMDSRAKVNLKF